MPTIFTMIINGDIPGRFVWQDERCVAFLSINPLSVGHTLVVPRVEVDHWLDLDEDLTSHLHVVAQRVGKAIQATRQPPRVCTAIAGFEVPHVHVHVYAADSLASLSWSNAATDPDPAEMDAAADAIRAELRSAGHGEFVPA